VGKLMALICAMALIAVPALARDKDREDKRLENSGRVLKEILDIPDDWNPSVSGGADARAEGGIGP